jgi:hypothetical protein
MTDPDRFQLPRSCGCVSGRWVTIIDEGNVMPDENIILNDNTATDKGVALDTNPFANHNISLNFDKRANTAIVPDFATVKVDELEYGYVSSKFNVVCNVNEPPTRNLPHALAPTSS